MANHFDILSAHGNDGYQQLIEFFPEAIIIHIEGIIVYTNIAAQKILGATSSGDLIGKPILEMVHPEDREKVLSAIMGALQNPYDAGIGKIDPEIRYIEERLLRVDGGIVKVEATGIAIIYEGKPAILTIGKELTHPNRYENLLNDLAYIDSLTGLYNRRWYMDVFRNRLSSHDYQELAILFMDLDGFKNVNDTYGHLVGDHFLKEVAEKIKVTVGSKGEVARFAGDEFIIILHSPEHLADLINEVINQVVNQGVNPQLQTYVTASIGVSLYPKDSENAETLLMQADKAMYMAKYNGKNQYCFFHEER
ncbi:GGDEF domain-containing protein [Bacillus sp. ISL-18]|uniref:sensor domain-containing diguanylate cyclase n=1 Tax=Bacillus sp. ISL-18 TaxID=2819118 RepID=UPI001BE713D1|nr:sensor domain-containing diguanylate cyclase [Bacillus sp. ISL-18]MBT2657903.1 GGDEF domain-containing protein [Bacillus sp. ISL-18]